MTQGEKNAFTRIILIAIALTVVLGGAKVAGFWEISWWLVLSPIWIPFVVVMGMFSTLLAFFILSDAIKERIWRNNK